MIDIKKITPRLIILELLKTNHDRISSVTLPSPPNLVVLKFELAFTLDRQAFCHLAYTFGPFFFVSDYF
jgi:hypothetical protein